MPEETGRIEKLLLAEDDPYRLIGEHLFEQWREEEFADLYSSEGKPGYSDLGIRKRFSVHGKIGRSTSCTSFMDAAGLEICFALATGGCWI